MEIVRDQPQQRGDLTPIQERIIGASVATMNDEIAFQLQGYNLDGLEVTTVRDVLPRYSLLKTQDADEAKRRSAADKAIVRCIDALNVVAKATKEGLIGSVEVAQRLALASADDEYTTPTAILAFLRGTSPHVQGQIAPALLAGSLEVHKFMHDQQIEDDSIQNGVVTVPMVLRAAAECGVDLSNPEVLLDDGAVMLISNDIQGFEFQADVSRATADGEIYHTSHRIAATANKGLGDDEWNPIHPDDRGLRQVFVPGMIELIEFDPDGANPTLQDGDFDRR